MAKNRRYESVPSFNVPVIAGSVSGSAVIAGMLPGVCLTDRDTAGNAVVRFEGAFDVSVTGAVASVGLPVYITSATGALVVAPGVGIQLFGHALQTKGAGAGTITVKIAPYAVASGAPA